MESDGTDVREMQGKSGGDMSVAIVLDDRSVTGSPHVQFDVRIPQRREETDALDVIEMEMREEEVDARYGFARPMLRPRSRIPVPASRMMSVPSSSRTRRLEVLPPYFRCSFRVTRRTRETPDPDLIRRSVPERRMTPTNSSPRATSGTT